MALVISNRHFLGLVKLEFYLRLAKTAMAILNVQIYRYRLDMPWIFLKIILAILQLLHLGLTTPQAIKKGLWMLYQHTTCQKHEDLEQKRKCQDV